MLTDLLAWFKPLHIPILLYIMLMRFHPFEYHPQFLSFERYSLVVIRDFLDIFNLFTLSLGFYL